ncbi:hypothetical protein COU59_03770 [Candidatus Pacearchaeota archaeon CG10_big_fil_rev_8_21_14_0_10_34_12]|nr:MAG: hypothetical protein COU59_03770 [Candidatus Pacearchaeota archaeon CG10_big_fil_rev_8_21_14_0_10_34_12]
MEKMHRIILKNRKGQIGETMTWVVATLVVIAVLGVSIVFTKTANPFSKEIYSYDKEKDFLASLSVTNFLSENTNVNYLENLDKNSELKIESLLLTMPAGTRYKGEWSLDLENSGDSETINLNLKYLLFPEFFNIKIEKSNLKLNFWAKCPTTCK